MRIVSDFHDYYDSVQKYGQEKSVLYLRKQQELNVDDVKRTFPKKYDEYLDMKIFHVHRVGNLDGANFRLLFFCGVVYPILTFVKYDGSFSYFQAFGVEEFENILKEQFDEKVIKEYNQRSLWTSFNREQIETFFSLKHKNSDLNIDLKCPIIIFNVEYHKNLEMTLNPSLKNLKFYKEVETGLAFQKIESFIGGVLASQQVPMIKVNDKTRLQKRGFDSKLSFRKQKEN